MKMNLTEALAIVIDLAEQNVIDDPDMAEERTKQLTAIRTVEEMLIGKTFATLIAGQVLDKKRGK